MTTALILTACILIVAQAYALARARRDREAALLSRDSFKLEMLRAWSDIDGYRNYLELPPIAHEIHADVDPALQQSLDDALATAASTEARQ